MDTQTRHALKQDSFVQATSSTLGWLEEHRSNMLRFGVPAVVVLAIAVIGAVVYNQRSAAADIALGQALTTYSTPLRLPGQPADPNSTTYATAAERAKAANAQFTTVENQYGWLEAGKQARYFTGITLMDMGQNASAEKELKTVADSGDRNLSALSKLALAGLYRQTGRAPQAIELYNQIIAKPADTVPAATAQLQLADLYQNNNQPEEARKIYAKLKDTEKTTAAGEIAAAKLAGK